MLDKVQEIRIKIKNKLPELTEAQLRVANYLIENPQKFAISSVRELEHELNVSKSTVVRFAQALGYDGFLDIKSEFLKSIRSELGPINRFKNILDHTEMETDMLQMIADQTIMNIEATLKVVDLDDYKRALKMIKKADHVFTMGRAMSSYLAEITAYLFSRVSIKAHAFTYGGLSFSEQIINLSENDLVFAFSFPPYSEETIRAASYVKEKNLKLISVTDKLTSKIVQYSDLFFQVAVDSITMSNSIMATLVLIYALAAQSGRELKGKTLETLESIQHVRKEH